MNIYYVFRLSDGAYMGSGVTLFDDDAYGSTLTPVPAMDEDGCQEAFWDGSAWNIV